MKRYEVITLYGVSQFKLDGEISRKMSLVEKSIWCWPCHDVESRRLSWITVSLVFLNEYSHLYSGSLLCRYFDSAACFPNIWFAVKLRSSWIFQNFFGFYPYDWDSIKGKCLPEDAYRFKYILLCVLHVHMCIRVHSIFTQIKIKGIEIWRPQRPQNCFFSNYPSISLLTCFLPSVIECLFLHTKNKHDGD